MGLQVEVYGQNAVGATSNEGNSSCMAGDELYSLHRRGGGWRDARRACVTLVLPHDGLVAVELFARGAHDAVLFAADVAAVRRLDGHLGVRPELEDERLRCALVGVDAAVALDRPVFAVVTCTRTATSSELSCITRKKLPSIEVGPTALA